MFMSFFFFFNNGLSSKQNNVYILANSLKSLLTIGIGSDFTDNNAPNFYLVWGKIAIRSFI